MGSVEELVEALREVVIAQRANRQAQELATTCAMMGGPWAEGLVALSIGVAERAARAYISAWTAAWVAAGRPGDRGQWVAQETAEVRLALALRELGR